jgi:chaperonin GroEL (HSP60 family)
VAEAVRATLGPEARSVLLERKWGTLLAHEIFSEGVRNVVVGTSAVGIKRGLQRGLDARSAPSMSCHGR